LTNSSTSDLSEIAFKESQDELTDHEVYKKLAERQKKNANARQILEKLSQTEYGHYKFWMKYCPDKVSLIKVSTTLVNYVLLIRLIFGSSFAVKYLEKRERSTIKKYKSIEPLIPAEDKPEFDKMVKDEEEHENSFADQIQGGYIKYISFIVLGLADALVEIAGIHAGSLGFYKSTELTGLAGIIAGAAASIAMASAAYAQAKQGFQGSAGLSAVYTGGSYFINALILASPYFLTSDAYLAIGVSLFFGVLIIAFISYYNSVISQENFLRSFGELAGIMLGATAALYVLGYFVSEVLHIVVS
jgi:vacuolar iron transporter family protein